MFDPYFIGKVERDNVKVLDAFGTKRFQLLKAVLKLGDNYHVVLLKPNHDRTRDQIVIDRLKHVFNLHPMHTFGLSLDFVYCVGALNDYDNMEYFAFATKLKEDEFDHVYDIRDLDQEQQEQAVMILMFRFIVSAVGNHNEHILIKGTKLVSISEGWFSRQDMDSEFASQFGMIKRTTWIAARERLMKGVLLDNIRGIVLQTENPTNTIHAKAPKGPLSIPVSRIMYSIEDRLDMIKNDDLGEVLKALNVV
jgi:hypothetical protein